MSPLEGYKGPDNEDNLSGKKNIPPFFEGEKSNIDGAKTTKKDLDALKQDVINGDVQLDNKVDEAIDVLNEQLGESLSKEEKEKLSTLLFESSIKSPSSKIFVDKVSTYTKEYGSEITIEDFKEIILMISEEEQKVREEENITNKQENITNKQEKLSNEQVRIQEEEKELLEKKENLNNLNNSLSTLKKGNKNYDYIKDKVNDLIKSPPENKLDYKEQYDEIINLLKTDENALYHISKDLQEQDNQNGTNTFGEFRASLEQMDKDFIPIFDRIDILPAKQKIALGVEDVGKMNISSNVLSKKTRDGFEIEAGVEGRKLSISGSEYKLGSKIDVRDDIKEVTRIEKEMKEEVSVMNETLSSIQGFKKYVRESIANGVEINDVKQNIKGANPDLYSELQLDLTTSLEQIIQGFNYLYGKIEKEKDKILKKIRQKVDEIVFKNALEAKEKDKSKKETLKILHKIGFDEIPQSVSDYAINMLNSNNTLKLLGFQSDIDIENGNLGTNFDNEKNKISLKEIQKFTELMNIIISGSKDYPVVINSLASIGKPSFMDKDGTIITDDKLQIFISEQLGSNPNSRVKINIEEYLENKDNNTEKENRGENSKQK